MSDIPGAQPKPPGFSLGRILITRNAQTVLHPDDVVVALSRHASGDWGDLDQSDKAANESALTNGDRLFSAYHDRQQTKFYIITEYDRSVTTVLLPEDY